MHKPAHAREASPKLNSNVIDADSGRRRGVDTDRRGAYTGCEHNVFEEDDTEDFFLALPTRDKERRTNERIDTFEKRRPIRHDCGSSRGDEYGVSRREECELHHEVPADHVAGAGGQPEVHGYRVGLVWSHGGGGEREVSYWRLGGAGERHTLVLGQGDMGRMANEYSR